MPSTFTWLDYSEHERRKMLDVIDLFGERTTRDELGLASVRDAFADMLFPGTSTIQTRARYFLFIPWIYRILEAKRVTSQNVVARLRQAEVDLMRALEASGEKHGLIGRRRKENVLRLPSSVYWQGLLVWGIRTFAGSQDEYHRLFSNFRARRTARRTASHEFEGESFDSADPDDWHAGLPPIPECFPQGASFNLSEEEAQYLRERIRMNCAGSLLDWLAQNKIPVMEGQFAWDLGGELPHSLQQWLTHGQNFSEIVWGAQLLYNLMLAERTTHAEGPEWQEYYEQQLAKWWDMMCGRQSAFQAWDIDRFWQIVLRHNPRISRNAKSFINQWIGIVRTAKDRAAVVDHAAVRALIEHREKQLKPGRARLHSARSLELWSGQAGADQLDLRWRNARRILADILAGLEGEHA